MNKMNLQLQPVVFGERNGGGVGLLEHRRGTGTVTDSGSEGVGLPEHRRDSGGSIVGAAYSAKTAEAHVYLTTIFGRQTGGDKKTFILWRYA